MPKALLVDTNFSSWPLSQALERRGLEVHVVGGNPADALAKAHPRHHLLDYSDTAALARLIEQLQPDHLVPGCNDRSYLSCAAVAKGYGFAGIDTPESTAAINDKAQFRQIAARHGMSVPRVFDWPGEVPDTDVIVKPVDAFSGKGVTVVRDPSEARLWAAAQTACKVSRSGQCIVEEFVEGQLYSHSAFLSGRRIVQDFWVVEHSSVNPFVVDTSHLALDLPAAVQAALRADVESLAHGLGLVDGLFHAQFIIKGGRHFVIEATRRCPGDLYSQLIQLSTGFDYPGAYVTPFCEDRVQPLHPDDLQGRFIMRHTLTGTYAAPLERLRFRVPLHIERWVPLASCGDPLQPSPLGRMAILFADTPSREALLGLVQITTAHGLYQINLGETI